MTNEKEIVLFETEDKNIVLPVTIESKSVHDFKFCKCKSVAVDGGRDYLRRMGKMDDWEELSVYDLGIGKSIE